MKKAKGLRKRWYMLRDLLGISSKKYNYKNNYTKYSSKKMKFYGQFEPKVDEFIFNRYFNDTNIKGVCIECGAYDGITDSCCKFFEETMGWTCYNFEPNPYNFKNLENNRPDSINLNLALSNVEDELEFNFEIIKDKDNNISCGGNGSLNKYTEEQKKSIIEIYKNNIDIVKVKTTTYKNFIEKYDIKFIDLFILDVEGHELSVLEGMQNCNVLPNIMVVEINDSKDFIKVRSKMEELDYIYDTTSFVNYFFIKKDYINLINLRNSNKGN